MSQAHTPRPQKLRVATAQYSFDAPKTLHQWEDKIESWVAKGAATGAQLLVFPEYAAIEQVATFGNDVSSDLRKTLEAVASVAGERVKLHEALAKEHQVHILVGSGPVQHHDGTITNTAQLVTPQGQIGTLDKLMMTPFERDWGVSAGTEPLVFETALGRIGVAICYDSEFPLLVRALHDAKADLILIPSCTERISGANRITTAARARALENACPVVVSPTVGDALWSPAVDTNVGRAGIYVPSEHGVSDDGVIAQGEWNAPGWVVGEINFTQLRALQDNGEMRNARDWSHQPGGESTAPPARLINLK